jgi:mono/diheme cytochrome c family protein
MRESALVVALLLVSTLGGCKKSGAGSDAEADELFLTHCARCHGVTGEGMKFAAPQGGGPAPPRNLTDPAFQSARTDAEIKRMIIEGKGPMPAFGKMLSDQELDGLVRKVRRLK